MPQPAISLRHEDSWRFLKTKGERPLPERFGQGESGSETDMKRITPNEAVRLCEAGEQMDAEERNSRVMERLRELVNYAKEHSAYYHSAYADIADDFALSDLPPTSKNKLMTDYSAWVTDPEITEDGVRAYVGSKEALEGPYLGRYTALTTSGTTGRPMPMVRDAYRNTIHGALIQTRLLAEVDKDLMNPATHRIAAILPPDPATSSYSSFLRMQQANPEHAGNLLAISLHEDLDEIVRQLNEFGPDLVTGYPSVLAVLAAAALDGRLRIQPQAIACSAETLTKEAHDSLLSAFGCPILNNYCSTEGGEAAMSCSEGVFHANADWVIIEPVDKDGSPVAPGEWSDGVYITDLTNYVQPVIRYWMEDRVRFPKTACSCGSALPVMEIRGRETGSMTVGGKVLFSSMFEQALEHIPGVLALQMARKGERVFRIRLISASPDAWDETAHAVKDAVSDLLSKKGIRPVEITVVNEKPVPSARGGKVKFLVEELE